MKEKGSSSQRRATPQAGGYSMLEIAIVLLIVSILLTLALPSYQGYTRRVHRTEAIQELLTMAGCQARIYAQTGYYDTTRCRRDFEGRYVVGTEPPETASTTNYLLIASPLGSQAADSCGALTLDNTGTRGISGPKDRIRACWNGR